MAIPYFELRPLTAPLPGGEVSLDAWTLFVVTGCVVGLVIARRRALRLGLEARVLVDGAVWTVGSGFVFGHVVEVLAYQPDRLAREGPLTLLRLWQGQSSYGGFLGAVVGSAVFYGLIRRRGYLAHADAITYGFPAGWFFGRLGCSVVHDHVGAKTDFFLGMDFDHGWSGTADPAPAVDGIRHELGLEEAAFTLAIWVVFVVLGRRPRPPGFFLGLFPLLYAPMRFCLDFLRNTDLPMHDARFWGLTPAQYGSVLLAATGAWVLARGRRA